MPQPARVRPFTILAVLVLALACGGGEAGDVAPADTLTRAQRDSALGASSLPGAGGVRGALDVSEAARRRAEALDSAGS